MTEFKEEESGNSTVTHSKYTVGVSNYLLNPFSIDHNRFLSHIIRMFISFFVKYDYKKLIKNENKIDLITIPSYLFNNDSNNQSLLKLDDLTEKKLDEKIASLYQGFISSVNTIDYSIEKSHTQLLESVNNTNSIEYLNDIQLKNSEDLLYFNTINNSLETEILQLQSKINELQAKKKSLLTSLSVSKTVHLKLSNLQKLILDRKDFIVKFNLSPETPTKSTRSTTNNSSPNIQDQLFIPSQPGTHLLKIPSTSNSPISYLDFNNPFGILVSTNRFNHNIDVYDLNAKHAITTLKSHKSSLTALQLDDHLIVSGSKDATVKLWDTKSLADTTNSNINSPLLHTFSSHKDEITAISLFQSSLITTSLDKTIRHWDLNTNKNIQTIPLPSPVSVYTSPIINTLQCFDAALATGSRDGIVRLWDLRIGKIVRSFEKHNDEITGLKFNNKQLVSTSLDNSIKIWDLGTGKIIDMFGYDHSIISMNFANDKIVCALRDQKSFQIYDWKLSKNWQCPPLQQMEDSNQIINDTKDDESNNNLEDETEEEQFEQIDTPPHNTNSATSESDSSDCRFVALRSNVVMEGRSDGVINAWSI
ncbi:hypothetical protein TBLA_0D05560 [Henningerozyma blattae CBS 6284]|uniref:Uncharacterized protein n=1 Tax=Henningerozyma blattae (strain ATCC 34711 / CBS 6284 / DSM 70876 / NBRC 10599 / NRRL Y-10934 / UCD 77-7) TaxID=1071380 RepID=I2H3U6_HENB6|nr:hypothetical protein TBLA_0D05560 [Tetrapisispora blattae CBS 6284]CCH61048.1 hypothetical protein TBLA_0D05560 [Tetrapisispora blattae CBS 6284]